MIKICKKKDTIAIDFDGVIHSYKSGWTGDMPEDPPTPGAKKFISDLKEMGYDIVIFSARAKTQKGHDGIKKWLKKYSFPNLKIEHTKPEAVLYIDDRGFRFDGNFQKALSKIKKDIRPWHELKQGGFLNHLNDIMGDFEMKKISWNLSDSSHKNALLDDLWEIYGFFLKRSMHEENIEIKTQMTQLSVNVKNLIQLIGSQNELGRQNLT